LKRLLAIFVENIILKFINILLFGTLVHGRIHHPSSLGGRPGLVAAAR
jgi:hypothetical protein